MIDAKNSNSSTEDFINVNTRRFAVRFVRRKISDSGAALSKAGHSLCRQCRLEFYEIESRNPLLNVQHQIRVNN